MPRPCKPYQVGLTKETLSQGQCYHNRARLGNEQAGRIRSSDTSPPLPTATAAPSLQALSLRKETWIRRTGPRNNSDIGISGKTNRIHTGKE